MKRRLAKALPLLQTASTVPRNSIHETHPVFHINFFNFCQELDKILTGMDRLLLARLNLEELLISEL